jgi:hypothetical protein
VFALSVAFRHKDGREPTVCAIAGTRTLGRAAKSADARDYSITEGTPKHTLPPTLPNSGPSHSRSELHRDESGIDVKCIRRKPHSSLPVHRFTSTMSRFVRPSKYRHTFANQPRKEFCYEGVKV